jgi:hypothetical protein
MRFVTRRHRGRVLISLGRRAMASPSARRGGIGGIPHLLHQVADKIEAKSRRAGETVTDTLRASRKYWPAVYIAASFGEAERKDGFT